GFDVRGRESQQEILMKRLLLCQIITMFMTLQKDGDFVLKVFDIFTPFTAALIWILYRHFEKICIIKPLPSRPANSERYVVCRNLKVHRPKITTYLLEVNRKFDEIRTSDGQDINEIVEFEVMKKDEEFMNYLETSNMKTAVMQTNAIKELQKYIDEPDLEMPKQDEYRRLCLQEWGITKAEE
ncbi:12382_t:CDS:2, partial [Acaulospora morrowiae]